MPTGNSADSSSEKLETTPPTKLSDKDLLTRIRTRFCLAEEADHENREKAREDMRFLHVPGEQWDPEVKRARGDRPCYEFNKTRIKAKRIVNEMRANRPAGKVRGVENADKKTAEIMEGLGRNILQLSDFDTISDYAGEYQVGAGLGAWRIVTEYAEDSFDQDILVKPIPDPFNLYWDPASIDPLHRDAEDWWLLDFLPNSVYHERYPNAQKVDFDAGVSFLDEADWKTDAGVRVCEYHWKERYDKELIQLIDGRVVDAADAAAQLINPSDIRQRRVSSCHRILMCIASGEAILTKPTVLKGKYHRFVAFHGEWKVIDGKARWCGLTRYAKDAQRAYNVASTAVTETIATAPNSHYWVTVNQAKGNTDQWKKAIAQNLPFLLYNPDTNAPGSPQRVGGADVPVALIQEAQIRDQELKDVTGVYDAALGERSNEKSGVAISRREQQTQIVNFNFPDNMAKAKQWTLTVINDLIPHHYDTERVVRVIGQDGAEEFVKVNAAGLDERGMPVLVNDLTRGKYDITVTVGPSYATQRQEAADFYTHMAAQDPMLMQTAPDLVYQVIDMPFSDQIAERRQAVLPPQVQALISKGKELPPEVKQAQAMLEAQKQQLDQQGQMLQAAAAELEQKKAEAEKAQSQVKVATATLDAHAAEKSAEITEREASLTLREARLLVQESAARQAPRRKVARAKRVNGELVVEMVEVAPEQMQGASMPPVA